MSETGQDPDAHPATSPSLNASSEGGQPATAGFPSAEDDTVESLVFARADTDEFLVHWEAFTASVPPIEDAGGQAVSRPSAPPPASRRRTGRRVRGAVFGVAALALLVAAGVGYAALGQDSPTVGALPPQSPVPSPTAEPEPEPTFDLGTEPGADPAQPAPSASASAAPTPAASATSQAPGRDRQEATPAPTVPVGRPLVPLATRPPASPKPTRPPATVSPSPAPSTWPPTTTSPTPQPSTWTPSPAPTTPAPSTAPVSVSPTPTKPGKKAAAGAAVATFVAEAAALRLTATLDRSAATPGHDVATVWITNPTWYDITGWTVTMTVPDGTEVEVTDGAVVSQRRGTVAFTPSGNATVPAGETVAFTFRMSAESADLADCAIDGRPCM